MTLLVWLAASSLVWGAVLWGAAIALQSGNDLSGRARQWIWRGAAVLLILPWLAVPVVGALAPGLSGSVAPPEEFSMAPVLADAPVTVTAMNVAAADLVERAEPAIVIPWIEIIVAAVGFGWLLRVVAAGQAMRHLGRIVSQSRPGEGASLAVMARWSRMLGLKRAPELRVVSASTSPFSTGVRKPLVCLPEGIEQNMHAQTLDLVVGHECIHVARGDGWRRPLERSIADIMWFNPFAWAIRRELDLARELACDEAVVAASSQRKAYARTLRVVAGMSAALPASAPAASMSLSGGGRLLAMRMKRTLDAAARKPAKAAIAGAVMLAFAATPMAIAQAILIEAVQPPDAPPAPPAPPVPAAPAAVAEVAQAPVPPAAPSVAAPAQAPQPPAAPKAPEHVQMSSGGDVLVGVPSRVVEIGGNDKQGYRVNLLQTSKNAKGETCGAKLDGLSRVVVRKDQVLAKGAVIGERGTAGGLGIAVRCSDETDSTGWPVGGSEPPAPPAPPTPPSPVDAVAPVAPVARPSTAEAVAPLAPVTISPRPVATPRAIPSGAIQPTPVTPVAPVAPVARPSPAEAVAPLAPVTISPRPVATPRATPSGAIQPTPVTPLTPTTPVTPAGPPARPAPPAPQVAPAPPTPPATPAPERVQLSNDAPKLEGAPSAVIAAPARFTSGYGYRTSPSTNEIAFHEGIDIAAARGTPVHTPGAGIVTFAGVRGSYGRVVEVDLGENYRVRFGHLNDISVVQGEALKAGDTVGTVGASGRPATGPHLHFEVLKDGKHIDPEAVAGLVLFGG